MFAVAVMWAMALKLKNHYLGTTGEVTTAVTLAVGVFGVFCCGFFVATSEEFAR